MISEFVQTIEGVESFPVLSLVLFLLAFVGVVIWTARLDRRLVQRMAQLPLDQDTRESAGETYHD